MAVTLLGTDDEGHPLTGRVRETGTTVVLFVGSACAISEMMVELAMQAAGEDGDLVVVDVDEEPLTAQHFKVRVLPSWLVWVDGRAKQLHNGAVNLAAVERMLGTGGIKRRTGMQRRR